MCNANCNSYHFHPDHHNNFCHSCYHCHHNHDDDADDNTNADADDDDVAEFDVERVGRGGSGWVSSPPSPGSSST